MPDPFTILSDLRRPQLLVRAAHLGLEDYDRDRCLRRILPDGLRTTARDTFRTLIEHEARMDAERVAGDATYSVARHIETLVALIFEARLLKRSAM
jgi:hypothetical protein